MVLFRALEWRIIYRHKMLFPTPILDLGCGDGWINHLVLGEDMTVGLDMAPESVQRAKNLIKRVVCGDARHLPFRHEIFGSIYSNCVIEHLPEIDACLAEAVGDINCYSSKFPLEASSFLEPFLFCNWNFSLRTENG